MSVGLVFVISSPVDCEQVVVIYPLMYLFLKKNSLKFLFDLDDEIDAKFISEYFREISLKYHSIPFSQTNLKT